MTLTPLATASQFLAGPFKQLARDIDSTELTSQLQRATRAIESRCDRRLAPFQQLVESQPLNSVAVDDVITTFQPMEELATLGYSRAMSLDGGNLTRHFWVKQWPPQYQDLWLTQAQVLSTMGILLRRSFSGDQNVNPQTIQYEPDTGHIRFALGTYAPPGTTVIVTYDGGYGTPNNPTIPDDLVQACIFQTAHTILLGLEPASRDAELSEIETELDILLGPFARD